MDRKPPPGSERPRRTFADRADTEASGPARPDWLTRAVTGCAVLTWLVIIAFFLLVAHTRPGQDSFLVRLFASGGLDPFLSTSVFRTATFLMLLAFAFCAAGLFLSARRAHNRTERHRRLLVILGSVSLVGAVISWSMFF